MTEEDERIRAPERLFRLALLRRPLRHDLMSQVSRQFCVTDFEIIIATVGTDGDAAPFFALAGELATRGFSATVMTNNDHKWRAAPAGVNFVAVANPDWPQIGRDDSAFFREALATTYPDTHAAIEQRVTAGKRILLIMRTGHFAAMFAAERYGLPVVRIALQPCAIRRRGHPISADGLALLNQYRSSIQLGPLDAPRGIEEPALVTLSLFPDWFGEPQSKWRLRGKSLGFPLLGTSSDVLPWGLSSLIDRFGAPVIFSMGTGVQEISTFVAAARSFCLETGLPVVFLSQYAEQISINLPERMQIYSRLEHLSLFPHASTVVHNGGIGTVVQCLRTGVPQLIVPLVYDQPDNARRVQELGVGRVISPELLDTGVLISAYRSMLCDPALPQRLSEIARIVGSSNGVTVAADAIQSLAGELGTNRT